MTQTKLVKDLKIGDVFRYHRTICVVVRFNGNRPLHRKLIAPDDNCLMGLDLYSEHFEDLQNRVTLATQAEIEKELADNERNMAEARRKFVENFPA